MQQIAPRSVEEPTRKPDVTEAMFSPSPAEAQGLGAIFGHAMVTSRSASAESFSQRSKLRSMVFFSSLGRQSSLQTVGVSFAAQDAQKLLDDIDGLGADVIVKHHTKEEQRKVREAKMIEGGQRLRCKVVVRSREFGRATEESVDADAWGGDAEERRHLQGAVSVVGAPGV